MTPASNSSCIKISIQVGTHLYYISERKVALDAFYNLSVFLPLIPTRKGNLSSLDLPMAVSCKLVGHTCEVAVVTD